MTNPKLLAFLIGSAAAVIVSGWLYKYLGSTLSASSQAANADSHGPALIAAAVVVGLAAAFARGMARRRAQRRAKIRARLQSLDAFIAG